MKRLLLLIPLLLLCGCWDYNEAAMQEYVLGVGIDYSENRYQVTIETADLSGAPESPGGAKLLKTEGETPFDAIRNAIAHAGKKLYWGHCALVVISGEIQNEKLHEVLDVFLRAQDVYQTVSVAIARDTSAGAIFASKHNGSDSVTAHILHIFQNQTSSRRFQNTELWEYVRFQSEPGCAILPTISVVNETAQVSGGAVYQNESLLGFLSGDEVLILSLLTNDLQGGWLSRMQVLPDTAISAEILANSVKQQGKTLLLTLTVAISSSDTVFDVSDNTTRLCAETAISETLTRRANDLLARSRREGFSELIGSDVQTAQITVRLQNSGMRTSEGGL